MSSTINHSSSAKEISHAIKVIKPQFFIVDGDYEEKLHEALGSEQYDGMTIMTMVSRLDGHLLVSFWSHFPNHRNLLTSLVSQRPDHGLKASGA
jgi:hypothetical protein